MSAPVNTQPLVLSQPQLEEIELLLKERILEGLGASGREIEALPSYYPPPERAATGRALVIDTGGTNMRAAVVELTGNGGSRITHGPLKKRLPVRDENVQMTPRELFLAQAELAKEISAPPGLPVGYCFSYPSDNVPSRDSRLIRWTKGIDVPGVEGTLIGKQLGDALTSVGLQPQRVRVLNDTVASMLGGAYVHCEHDPERSIGLIVGTGTNISAFFGRDRCNKVPASWTTKMAINLESGNFAPPHLTEWDAALDAASDNPRQQRFEKAVSGHYLPFLFDRILPGQRGFDPHGGSKTLVDYRDLGLEDVPRQVAGALLARSADLVAAALASVMDLYEAKGQSIGILAEGSLIWNDPKYAPRVIDTLSRLLGDTHRARILRLDDANLIGSACAALDRDR